jgi:hypothetical protein
VASDALALSPDDPLHLPWPLVLTAAAEAHAAAAQARSFGSGSSGSSGSSSSSSGGLGSGSASGVSWLRALQFPMNVLEPRGAELAKEIGAARGDLRLMATRPLTAVAACKCFFVSFAAAAAAAAVAPAVAPAAR